LDTNNNCISTSPLHGLITVVFSFLSTSKATKYNTNAAFCRLEILRQQNPSDVEVAIEPEELEGLDEASIQALYNQRVAEERARNAREVCNLSPWS